MFTKTPLSDSLQAFMSPLSEYFEVQQSAFFLWSIFHPDLASLPLSAICCPKVKSQALHALRLTHEVLLYEAVELFGQVHH